ncbi:MAG: MATE family efflux transporter [Deltaproteobacteria bacterium]|nr:MATE family efflux transporter [Deltaproteobacteria bacterium]
MQDFTEGNIAKQFIRFSTPIMLGNVLMSFHGIINMIWVGRLLGHKAVAAVSASLPIIMLMPAILIGMGMSTNILIAQAFGRKDTGLLRKILANSFFTSILCCLFISIIALALRRQLLEWVHVPKEIQDMALSYLTIIMATLVFSFFLNWMNSTLNGLGDSVTVLKILSLLTFFNIIYVPVLISGVGPLPPLGVAGAACGTALAAVTTGIVGYIYLVRRNPYINMQTWDFRPDWYIIRQVFAIGVPASLQMLVISVAGVIIISLVNRYGTDVTAAFGISMQIDMLAMIPFMSIGMAATTISGQNLGAQKIDRVYETLRVSIFFGLVVALVCTTVLAFFSYDIGGIFLKESVEKARVLAVIRDYYRWMAFIYPCFAVTFAVQGVLRSAGDTMALLALSFIAMIVLRIPLAYGLAGPAGFKQDGIWMAMFFSVALAVGFNWLYYKSGLWEKKVIFARKT